ncbi:hypothetical protein [Aquibacillus kalidii]|nr:hypothetical protein [Aquibacillus kalidii]
MKRIDYLDPTAVTEGEELVAQQLMESYHSGVIDHDVEVLNKKQD